MDASERTLLNRVLPARVLRWEPWLVWLAGTLAFVAVPLSLGDLGISWDALNHHIYLGWVAAHPRFDRDFLAAAYQSYQYPYLYWPVYKLAMAGASGREAGAALAALQALAVPPVWWIAHWCCPGRRIGDVSLRVLGVALAFLGGLTLSMLDTTSNDVLAAIPFLWAIALATLADGAEPRAARAWMLASGVALGTSVAFKFSNGPIALAVPMLWWLGTRSAWDALGRLLSGAVGAVLGFCLAYGYWGWHLWQQFGNPIYPFYPGLSEWLRVLAGWQP